MTKQQVIKMLQDKQRKCLEIEASGHQAPLLLTPLEANQIMTALVQPDVLKMKRTQELLSELTQIVGEQA